MLAYLQLRGQRVVQRGELLDPLGLRPEQERDLFQRMARGGVIVAVRPGLYLVPERLPLGGAWSPDEGLAIETLMADRGGHYQICGPNAFHRHGFVDQVPNRLYAYNDRISGERAVGSVEMTLIKVSRERLGETIEDSTGTAIVTYSSRVRTLMDAVYDWSRFDSLPRAYRWISTDLAVGRADVRELVRVTLRYGDVGTIRRMGALLDREGVDSRQLKKLERALNPTTGLIPFDPVRPKRGRSDRRWGIVWNE